MKKRISFGKMTKQSNILNMLRKVSAYVTAAFKRSFLGGLVVSDGNEERMFNSGFTRSLLIRQVKRNSPMKKVRRFISSEFEKSRVFSLIQQIYRLFFAMKLKSIGVFTLSYAIFASLAIIIQYYPFDGSGWFAQVLTVLALLLVSVPFLLSKKNIAETMQKSKLFSSVIIETLGVDFDHKIRDSKSVKLNPKLFGLAPVLGIACGALSVYVPPISFVSATLMVLLAAFILSKPEAGLVLVIFAIPLSEMMLLHNIDILGFFIIVTAFGYAGKLLLGRREFVIDFFDIFMLIALVTVASGCIGTSEAGSYSEIRRICLFMCVYFLVVNLIKTRGWFLRASNALVFSLCVILFIGVAAPVASRIPYICDIIPSLDTLEGVYLFARPSEAVYLLIPAIPFILAETSCARPGLRSTYIAYLCLAVVCVFIGGNPVAFPAIIASILVYVLCVKPSTVAAILPLGMINISLSGLYIPVVSDIIASGETFAQSTGNENLNVALGSLRALKDYWLTGIGFGSDSFSKIYPNYAYAGFENATDAGVFAVELVLGFGIFGTIIIFCTILLFMRETFGRIVRIDNVKDKAFLAASASSVFGYVVAAFSDNILSVETVGLYIFIIMAISSSYMRIVGMEDRRRSIQHPDTPDHVDMTIPAKLRIKK